MIRRLLKPSLSRSFFLFGARGTGKTFLLREIFAGSSCLWINLLEARQEHIYVTNPDRLSAVIASAKQSLAKQSLNKQALNKQGLSNEGTLNESRSAGLEWIIIDEVQKVPKLLDIVHNEIAKGTAKFALTGSSARKLKRGGANLLAGRAFVFNLFPLTHVELGEEFNLSSALRWGTLPEIYSITSDEEKSLFLDTYINTYLKEEVIAEQLVRNLDPFRRFLEVAAQSNGTIINYRRIGEDIGANEKTVKSYFEIFEDTLIGFRLPPFSRSIRKQQIESPKFYLFDCGVKRALQGLSGVPIGAQAEWGLAFEHFVITEVMRLNSYLRRNYSFSFFASKSGAEIDLVVERPGKRPAFIEIKSSDAVQDRHLNHLKSILDTYKEAEGYCFCNETVSRKVGEISVVPWQDGLREIGLGGG